MEEREMKKLPISEIAPGMITAQDIYSRTDQLVLNKGIVLGADSIAKLMFYSIGGVWVYREAEQELEEDAYTDTLRKSQDFIYFKKGYNDAVAKVKIALECITMGDSVVDTEELVEDIKSMVSEPGNNAHIFNMLHCIREFDDIIFMHSVNSALICSIFGDWLHLSEEDRNALTLCGLLHDAGKLLIPPRILNKPGRLTDEEFDIAKMHAESGFELLKQVDIDDRIKLAALNHHERYDGSGYPAGKSGGAIDMFSTVVGIADMYDAMTSRRIYRGAICPFHVIRVFEEDGVKQFNPRYLLPLLKRLAETYIHHTVRLSDDSRGEVVMINPSKLASPVVRVENSFIDLSKKEDVRVEAVL